MFLLGLKVKIVFYTYQAEKQRGKKFHVICTLITKASFETRPPAC